jgi:chromosome segregation ATPase
MRFENEFLNVVDEATVYLEQQYQSRIKKLTDELKDWKSKQDFYQKQLDSINKKIDSIQSELDKLSIIGYDNLTTIQKKKRQDLSDEFSKVWNDKPRIEGILNNIKDKEIPNKQKEIDSVQKEFAALPSQQSKEITQAAINTGLSQTELEAIKQTQLDIELHKKETNKIKIFMGVGVGLVTLLILFKTIK